MLPMTSPKPLHRRVLDPIVRGLFYSLEGAAVWAANLRRDHPRQYARHKTWDLLVSHRLSQMVRPGESVLDVGCGNALRLEEIGMFTPIVAHGTDIAGERHIPPNVSYAPFDGRTLPYADGAFDVTLMCFVLHYLTRAHATALVNEAIRVSRRRFILLEDSQAEFNWLYRVRNRCHNIQSNILYNESPDFRWSGGVEMFLNYEQWREFLLSIPRVAEVTIHPLNEIVRYRHHTMIEVSLA